MSGCCVGPRIVLQGGEPPPPPVFGFAVLPAILDLQPTASGAWTDSALDVQLPEAGTYHLDATVRGRASGVAPINVFIVVRLFDVTAGQPVPDSEAMVVQVNTGAGGSEGDNDSAPIQVEHTVPGPTTIRLQGQRTNTQGVSVAADIQTSAAGKTTLRFQRVGT